MSDLLFFISKNDWNKLAAIKVIEAQAYIYPIKKSFCILYIFFKSLLLSSDNINKYKMLYLTKKIINVLLYPYQMTNNNCHKVFNSLYYIVFYICLNGYYFDNIRP